MRRLLLPDQRCWHWALLALALLAMLAPTDARGAGGAATSAAGLVIDTGEGEPIYVVVTFEGADMNALDLLRETDLDAVTVDFGGLGEAVCSIATIGCDVSSCRQRLCQTSDPTSPFWQYLEQNKDGTWSLSPLGASHATAANGDIAAWAWTGVPPDLPNLSWRDLAERAGAPAAIANGDVAGEPTVFVSRRKEDASGGDASSTVAGAGVVVLVAMVGGWLVMRRRRGTIS